MPALSGIISPLGLDRLSQCGRLHRFFCPQDPANSSSQIDSFLGVPGYALSIRAVVRKLLCLK
jgi:hypothetical protein